jgi:hypothetical protein
MSGHHPMRMSPDASALRLRTCVMLPGLRRRRLRLAGSGATCSQAGMPSSAFSPAEYAEHRGEMRV